MAAGSQDGSGSVTARVSPRWLSLLAAGLYVIAFDQLTKDVVRTSLDPGEGLHVGGGLWIASFRNAGIAGGSLAGAAIPAALLATALVLGILFFLARHGVAGRGVLVGFGLLIGGGMGNLVDRVRLGYVTDFLVHGDYAYNFADVAIFAGTTLIVVGLCVRFVQVWPLLRR